MIGRLGYILVLVFISKTLVKAGAIFAVGSSNPKAYEILKKDRSFYSYDKNKSFQKISCKRKIRPRALKSQQALLAITKLGYLFDIPALRKGYRQSTVFLDPFLQVPLRAPPAV